MYQAVASGGNGGGNGKFTQLLSEGVASTSGVVRALSGNISNYDFILCEFKQKNEIGGVIVSTDIVSVNTLKSGKQIRINYVSANGGAVGTEYDRITLSYASENQVYLTANIANVVDAYRLNLYGVKI